MVGTNSKSRRGGVADATTHSTSKALRLRDAVSATTAWTLSATARALASRVVRPIVLALVLLVLIWLALTFLGRFERWMTAAGVLMVLLSVASAVQEFAHPPKAVQSYQDLLDATVESCSGDKITLPSMAAPPSVAVAKPVKAVAVTPARRSPRTNASAAPAIVTNPVLLESGGVSVLKAATAAMPKTTVGTTTMRRRKSEDCAALESVVRLTNTANNTASDLSNQLLVLHCGTVIDIEGSRGFLLPHAMSYDAGFKTVASKKKSRAAASAAVAAASLLSPRAKLPLVLPFDVTALDASGVRPDLAVGRTVEFAFGGDVKGCALNVTPVASAGELERSRHALLTCKQAREQSFARAMCDLKPLAPRHAPVTHVDLIKYAEQLDDHEPAIEQFM